MRGPRREEDVLYRVDSLDEFAEKFNSLPFAIYRGIAFHPMYVGYRETPCFRYHPMPLSRWREGEIISTHPDGTPFKTNKERTAAALNHAKTRAVSPIEAHARQK